MGAVVSVTDGGHVSTVTSTGTPHVSVVREDGSDAVSVVLTYDQGERRAVVALSLDDILTALVDASRIGGDAVGRHVGRVVLDVISSRKDLIPTNTDPSNVVRILAGRKVREC